MRGNNFSRKLIKPAWQAPVNVFGLGGLSINTDDRRNASATLLSEIGYFFVERTEMQLV